jgi:HD-GYP domain-containing protein (c-di-GMP phosphodiesterase class II)
MQKIRSINQGDIILNRPLAEDVCDRNGVLLLKKGFIIKSQKQLNSLFQRGACFMVDITPEEPFQRTPPREIKEPTPFELLDDVYEQLTNLCSRQSSKFAFSSKLIGLCKKIQTACLKNPDATLGAIILGKDVNYSITHQIHCAIICEILSRNLEYPAQERLMMIAAGLTMNIAMIELQTVLFNQKEKLSDEMRLEVQSHPSRGVELLREYGVTDESWLTSVLQHHEFIDGSGYPQGLRGEDIDFNSRMLTLADVYCVKLFSRAYRLPLPPDVAVREIITGSRGQGFDQELARILVKEIGIYHPGSLVQLINGEIAVVTQRGKKIHHPIVQSVLKEDGVPLVNPIRRDCSKENYSIIYSVAPQQITVDINKNVLWGY